MLTALPVRAAPRSDRSGARGNAGILQHVDDLGGGRRVRRLVDVGQQRQSRARAHVREDAEAGIEPRPRNDFIDVRLSLS